MKAVMEKRWRVACLCAALAWPALGVETAAADPLVEGTWRIEHLILDIFNCQNLVCGRIVWLEDAARRPFQCGKTIVWGLKQTGASEWAGGSILDPDNGKTYQLSATFQPDGTLRARIYRGIELLGQTKILRRVSLRSLTGWC
jgi:uncharacterized protein (DUF2147 family)